MIEYDSWYQKQIDMGNLPDEDGYYHWPPKEFFEVIDDEFGD